MKLMKIKMMLDDDGGLASDPSKTGALFFLLIFC